MRRTISHEGTLSGREALPLNLNDLVREAVQRTAENRVRLHALSADEDVRILGDPEEMSQVLATLVAYGSKAAKRGGIITIQVKVLRIENALLEKSGCALVTVSSPDIDSACQGGRVRRRKAFRAIRSVIRGHSGSLRIVRQKDSATVNIYLPILHHGAELLSAGARREEGAWRQ